MAIIMQYASTIYACVRNIEFIIGCRLAHHSICTFQIHMLSLLWYDSWVTCNTTRILSDFCILAYVNQSTNRPTDRCYFWLGMGLLCHLLLSYLAVLIHKFGLCISFCLTFAIAIVRGCGIKIND